MLILFSPCHERVDDCTQLLECFGSVPGESGPAVVCIFAKWRMAC